MQNTDFYVVLYIGYDKERKMNNERKTPLLCLKLGVTRALFDGKTVALDASAIQRGGRTLIPSCALLLLGIKCENEYTPLDEVKDYFTLENEMGLIFFDKAPIDLTVENDIEYMLTLAQKFIFEIEVPKMGKEYSPATEYEREGFMRVGKELKELLLKRNNTHPFVFGTQEIFDKLREIYSQKSGDVYNYLKALVDRADRYRSIFPPLNENGDGLVGEFPSSGYGETEYDVGGRHSHSEDRLLEISHFAFAYQITHDESYARLAYFCALNIIKRKHWGPGHFLNCSGATGKLVMIYDWLYNVWRELKLDTGAIKRGIYDQGLHHGYNSAILDSCDYPSPMQGTGWRFKLKNDNWNSVCNSGLILGSLCLLAEGSDEVISSEEYEKITELLGACISSTMQPHLVFTQYAPDGSYVESNSYWAYGTTNLINTMSSLYDSLGTDLGLHHACGFDKTAYYAINTESAEYVGWNYHDGGLGAQNTSSFNQLATISGDDTLYAIREDQLRRGKGISLLDMLYHPTVRNRNIPELSALPLDYAMVGIDAFTVRDGWSRGSLFAGIMGGKNPDGGSHNQLDSGAFVYHNLGKLWFTDLGSDNYNSRGIANGEGYFSNYALYRRNAEGNNCLCLTSLPFGQLNGGRGVMTEHRSNGNVSYAVIDNLSIYGNDKVESAKRGMLLTNERKTLIIKDEVLFVGEENAFSTAHFNKNEISADISNDKKRCTLTHKDGEKIYVRLIGDGELELLDCSGLLTGTAPAEGEHSRDDLARLVVRYNGVRSINTSFVIDTEEILCLDDIPDIEMWKTL